MSSSDDFLASSEDEGAKDARKEIDDKEKRKAALSKLSKEQAQVVAASGDDGAKRKAGKSLKKGKGDKIPRKGQAGEPRIPRKNDKAAKRPGEKAMWDDILADSEDDVEGAATAADKSFIDDAGVEKAPSDSDSDGEGSVRDVEQAEEAGEGDEELESFFKSKSKRGRKFERTDEEIRVMVQNFLAKMDDAAETDAEANRKRKPALAKLQMLPEVVSVLSKRHLQETFLDNGALGTLKTWIEPLPDGSLPNIKIRQTLLTILDDLPVDLEQPDRKAQLKKSGLGRVVLFLSKLPDETTTNRKLAAQLVQKWSRPLFELTTRYEDLRRFSDDTEVKRRMLKREVEPAEQLLLKASGDDNEMWKDGSNKAAEPTGKRIGTRIPRPSPMDFIRRPEYQPLDADDDRRRGKSERDDPRQKMEKNLLKLRMTKKVHKAEKLSVEGRGMVTYN
eukprot:jgi/Chlat1/4041/Chrsp26S04092